MRILTAKEFRDNQKKYLDLAAEETIIIPRARKKPIVISEWDESDIPTKEDLKNILSGIDDIKSGRITFVSAATLWEDIK